MRSEEERRIIAITALMVTFEKDGDSLLDIYRSVLADIPADHLELACKRAIATCKFMPKPAEIRELAQANPEDIETRAAKAWGIVNRAAAELGAYRTVDFEDRTINATVRGMAGNWPRFIEVYCSNRNEEFHRKDFLASYKAFASGISEEAARPLPGLAEATNAGHLATVHRIGQRGVRRVLQAKPKTLAMLPIRVSSTAQTTDDLPRFFQPREETRQTLREAATSKLAGIDRKTTDELRKRFLLTLNQGNPYDESATAQAKG